MVPPLQIFVVGIYMIIFLPFWFFFLYLRIMRQTIVGQYFQALEMIKIIIILISKTK